jgi:hypothetical protein
MSNDETPAIRLSAGDYEFHRREVVRLRALAKTVTTPAVKARVLQQAEEHARLAGLTPYEEPKPS